MLFIPLTVIDIIVETMIKDVVKENLWKTTAAPNVSMRNVRCVADHKLNFTEKGGYLYWLSNYKKPGVTSPEDSWQSSSENYQRLGASTELGSDPPQRRLVLRRSFREWIRGVQSGFDSHTINPLMGNGGYRGSESVHMHARTWPLVNAVWSKQTCAVCFSKRALFFFLLTIIWEKWKATASAELRYT